MILGLLTFRDYLILKVFAGDQQNVPAQQKNPPALG